MDAKEKKKFIKELCDNVRNDAMSKAKDMPEFWDGYELRQYLADKFADATMTKMRADRRRRFNNEKLIRNL